MSALVGLVDSFTVQTMKSYGTKRGIISYSLLQTKSLAFFSKRDASDLYIDTSAEGDTLDKSPSPTFLAKDKKYLSDEVKGLMRGAEDYLRVGQRRLPHYYLDIWKIQSCIVIEDVFIETVLDSTLTRDCPIINDALYVKHSCIKTFGPSVQLHRYSDRKQGNILNYTVYSCLKMLQIVRIYRFNGRLFK